MSVRLLDSNMSLAPRLEVQGTAKLLLVPWYLSSFACLREIVTRGSGSLVLTVITWCQWRQNVYAAWHRGEQANFKRCCNCYTVLAAASPFLRDPIQLQGTLRSAAWLLARQIQTSSYSLCPKTKHGMNLSMVCASEQAHNKPIKSSNGEFQMPVFYWKTWKNCGESLTRYLDVFGGIFCLRIHRTLCWTQAMQNTSKNVKKMQDCTPTRRSGCNAETGWCVVHFPGPLCPSSPCRDLWPRNVIEFPDESTS